MTDTTKREKIEFNGLALRRIREERRLSREDLKAFTGIPVITIKYWESENRRPSKKGLAKLNDYFNVDFYRTDLN